MVSSDFLRAIKNSLLRENQLGRRLGRFSVRGLTDLAALLAGRKRPALRAEWRAHLAGWSGHDSADWQKVRQALGFVASAIRCRCSDTADAAWVPVDTVLKSRMLSNLFVLTPTVTATYIVFRHEGTLGAVKAAESISAIYIAFFMLVVAGRKYRGVKPSEPRRRRVKELQRVRPGGRWSPHPRRRRVGRNNLNEDVHHGELRSRLASGYHT
jgi:hypothetical protein